MRHDLKRVKNCFDCKKPMPKFSKHHIRCDYCWEQHKMLINNGSPDKKYLEIIKGKD
jgi:hypothetical protein